MVVIMGLFFTIEISGIQNSDIESISCSDISRPEVPFWVQNFGGGRGKRRGATRSSAPSASKILHPEGFILAAEISV